MNFKLSRVYVNVQVSSSNFKPQIHLFGTFCLYELTSTPVHRYRLPYYDIYEYMRLGDYDTSILIYDIYYTILYYTILYYTTLVRVYTILYIYTNKRLSGINMVP